MVLPSNNGWFSEASPAHPHRGSKTLDGGVAARSVLPLPTPSSVGVVHRRMLASPPRSPSPPPSRGQTSVKPTRKAKASPADLKTASDPKRPTEKREKTAMHTNGIKGHSTPVPAAPAPKKAARARDHSPATSDGFSSFGSSDGEEEAPERKPHSTEAVAGGVPKAVAAPDAKHSKSDDGKAGSPKSSKGGATSKSSLPSKHHQKADPATRPKTAAALPSQRSKEGASGTVKTAQKSPAKPQSKPPQPTPATKPHSPTTAAARTAILQGVAAAKFRASTDAKRVCDKCHHPYTGFGTTCSKCRHSPKVGTTVVCKDCGGFFQGYGEVCPDCQLEEDRAALFKQKAEAEAAETARCEQAAQSKPETISRPFEFESEGEGAALVPTGTVQAFAPSSSDTSRFSSRHPSPTSGASPLTSARGPSLHSKSAILATVAAVKFRDATSDERHCDKCGNPYKGFGTTCGKCRHAGKRGSAMVCIACRGFFQGYGELCAECKLEEERVLLFSKQAVDRSDEFSAFASSDGEAPPAKPAKPAADSSFGGSIGSLLGSREDSFASLSQAVDGSGDAGSKQDIIRTKDAPAFSQELDKDVNDSSFTTAGQPAPAVPGAVLAAVREGSTTRLAELLAAGCEANEATSEGVTALLTAAVLGDEDCAVMLLEAGADVNRSDCFGSTPLQSAAFDGHFGVVRILLKAGATVDAQDCEGFTALHFAVLNTCGEPGFQEVLDDLVAAGADRTIKAKNGSSPASVAEELVKSMPYLRQIADAWRP